VSKPTNNRARNHAGEEPSVETQVLDALAEFSDALKQGEVSKRSTCRQAPVDFEPTTYGAESERQ